MAVTIETGTDRVPHPSPSPPAIPRISYVAYPSSLTLRSANAVQTYATVNALRAIAWNAELIVPRFAWRRSAFADLRAVHLARIPFNAGRHIARSTLWSYAERTWFALRVLLRLAHQRLRHRCPDVLYVRDVVCAAWLVLLAERVACCAVIYEAHDFEAENRSANSGPLARRVAAWLDRITLTRSDAIASLTETFVAEIGNRFPNRVAGTMAVIPDAYDDARYSPRDRIAARSELGIAVADFVVAYAGLTFAYHGVDTLLDAFALFAASHAAARLVLVGGRDRERADVAARAAQLSVADRVTIVPPQPNAAIPTYLAAADLLAIPDTVTKASASPLKLFEYAAMGKPIVAVDLPALREILAEDAAVYVESGSPDAIAAAMSWVHEHPAAAEVKGERARLSVARYTYTVRATAILDLCRTISEHVR